MKPGGQPGGCNRSHISKVLKHLTGLPNLQPSHNPWQPPSLWHPPPPVPRVIHYLLSHQLVGNADNGTSWSADIDTVCIARPTPEGLDKVIWNSHAAAVVAAPIRKLWPEYEPKYSALFRIDCTEEDNCCQVRGRPSVNINSGPGAEPRREK